MMMPTENTKIDSRPETYKHIQTVQQNMNRAIQNLMKRSEVHDQSKLNAPELEIFDEYTSKLRGCTYGSKEYEDYREKMKSALDHHYAVNDHHPEHNINGVQGMSLMSLQEMICDWYAATQRHADGDLMKSIEINQKRFGYSDELKQILLNTVKELGFFHTNVIR